MSKIPKDLAGKKSGVFSRNYNSYASKRHHLLAITLVARCMVLLNTRLNSLDYFVWGVLVREVNYMAYNTKEVLIEGIWDVMVNMDTDTVVYACSSLWSRLEKMVANDGV